MIIVILFFLQLLILFLFSRQVHKKVSLFFFLLTNNIKRTVHLMAFLFFPGTVIHEVSHFLMAHLLFVPTGEMNLLPKMEGDGVRLGSVMIGKADPLRRLLIGVAPFLVGTAIIFTTLFIAESYQLWTNIWYSLLCVYILFQIGNTMFSSSKDLEGALSFIILLIVLSLVFYFLGIRFTLSDISGLLTDPVINTFYQGVVYLTIPLVLDIIIIITFSLLSSLLQKK